MQQILSALGQEGMILAKDVMTPENRVLCGKGTKLTANIIDRLLKMEIMHITVEGHPVTIPGEKSLEEELKAIEERFADVKGIAPLVYIKKRIIQKLIDSRGRMNG